MRQSCARRLHEIRLKENDMPSRQTNIKNEKMYEGSKERGMSKQRTARIANAPGASKRGGQKSRAGTSRRSAKQGGMSTQKRAAGRKGGRARKRG